MDEIIYKRLIKVQDDSNFIRQIAYHTKHYGIRVILDILNEKLLDRDKIILIKNHIEVKLQEKCNNSNIVVSKKEINAIVIFILRIKYGLNLKQISDMYDMSKASVSIKCTRLGSLKKNNAKNTFFYNFINEFLNTDVI